MQANKKLTYENLVIRSEKFKNKLIHNHQAFKIMISSVYKTPETYVYAFVIPAILTGVLYFFNSNVFSQEIRSPILGAQLMSGGFGIMFLVNAILGEWRDSIFIRRIKSFGISKSDILSLFIAATLTLILPSLLLNIGLSLLLDFLNDVPSALNMLQFLFVNGNGWSVIGFLFSYLCFCMFSLIISILATSWIRLRIVSDLVVVAIIILVIFGTDMVFDPLKVYNNPIYLWIGYFIPPKYAVWMGFMFSANMNIDPRNLELIVSSDATPAFSALWQPIVYSLVLMFSLMGTTYLTFRLSRK